MKQVAVSEGIALLDRVSLRHNNIIKNSYYDYNLPSPYSIVAIAPRPQTSEVNTLLLETSFIGFFPNTLKSTIRTCLIIWKAVIPHAQDHGLLKPNP